MSYTAEVLADSPDIYFRLDETGAGPFVDQVAAHNATTSGTIVTAATLLGTDADASAKFDSATTLNKATTAYTINQQPLTIEFWVKPTTLSSSNGTDSTVVSALPVAGTSGWEVAYVLTTGVWRLLLGNVAFYNFSSAVKAQIGVVQHVVFVLTTTTVELFVNGVSQGSLATGTMLGPGGSVVIAGSNLGTGGRAKATIDEVAIYKAALTPTRIAAHYDAGTQLAIAAVPASATADAAAPAFAYTASAVVASATASAPTPTPRCTFTAPSASASASAPTPAWNTTFTAPPGSASASAPAPSMTLTIAAVPGSASASAPTPGLRLTISTPSATATASGGTVTFTGGDFSIPGIPGVHGSVAVDQVRIVGMLDEQTRKATIA